VREVVVDAIGIDRHKVIIVPLSGIRLAEYKASRHKRHRSACSLIRSKELQMNSTPTTTVGARVKQRHADQLRQIADRNASTISRTIARLISDALDGPQQHDTPSTAGDQR
jgi:hypothetical protein